MNAASIILELKKCGRCQGSGQVLEGMALYAAIFTFGATHLAGLSEYTDCPQCYGYGVRPDSGLLCVAVSQ
jgi:hypothetical protein